MNWLFTSMKYNPSGFATYPSWFEFRFSSFDGFKVYFRYETIFPMFYIFNFFGSFLFDWFGEVFNMSKIRSVNFKFLLALRNGCTTN